MGDSNMVMRGKLSRHGTDVIIHLTGPTAGDEPPLPENLQKILDQQIAQQTVTATASSGSNISGNRLPFEPKGK